MKALLIPADGPPREADLPDGGGIRFMRSLRKLIGTDCAERIQVTTRWEAWLDENGSAADRPVNEAVSRVARDYGTECALLGTVVITGLDHAGEPASLSPVQAGIVLGKIAASSA